MKFNLLLAFLALSHCSISQTNFEGTWVYVDKPNYKDYFIISRSGGNYLVERVYREKIDQFWDTEGSFKQIFSVKNGLIDLGYGWTMGQIENGTKILYGGREYLKKSMPGSNNQSAENITPGFGFEGNWVYVNKPNYKDYLIISKSGENYLVERVYREKVDQFWDTDGSFKQIFPVKNGLIDLNYVGTMGLIANGTKILFGGREYLKSGNANKETSTTSQNKIGDNAGLNNNSEKVKAEVKILWSKNEKAEFIGRCMFVFGNENKLNEDTLEKVCACIQPKVEEKVGNFNNFKFEDYKSKFLKDLFEACLVDDQSTKGIKTPWSNIEKAEFIGRCMFVYGNENKLDEDIIEKACACLQPKVENKIGSFSNFKFEDYKSDSIRDLFKACLKIK